MSQSCERHLPTLLAIRSAPPPFRLTQEEFHSGVARGWYKDLEDIERLMAQTRVRQRGMFWDPRQELAGRVRGTGERMRAFEESVIGVAQQSVEAVLEGVDRERVGSFVTTTNTGYFAPFFDCVIARRLGLSSSLRRTVIGSMGCFAAFNTFKVALDSLAVRPDELVLLNCTEASSISMQSAPTKEQAVVQYLFGDASASMLLGSAPEGEGLQFLRTHTEQLYETADMMTLRLTDEAFRMTLSPFVPFVLAENIEGFLKKLLGPAKLSRGDIRHWGIHPGGPKIIEFLTRKLELRPEQSRASWHVLENHGNCAAAATLLVLEDILRQDKPARGDYGVLMAFGPGLTVEGALVRF
ncbi:type III polyketide synthase [Hyalangium gracile]|uniref:type III polyketide synthase n=1 Tax=Hyalangium gracile TaxID=394092 RepID=UPI001CCEF8F8|nr:3-oxoacyl-[acyl-carrier-protein] synthase III C-terminal domain-containing protein [Hyalangium gracile]